MIKAIIFDLDDTLYCEREYVFCAFRNVAEYISGKYNLDVEEMHKEIINIFYEKGRGNIFNIFCKKYKLKEDIKKLVDIYRNTDPKNIDLYEDSKEIICWAKENGYKLGIITDGMSKVQWKKIQALNLEKMFDSIIVSDDLGRENWKPSVEPYKKILENLNLKNNEVIYIGDNPNKDFIGAKKLGIKTYRIVREVGDHMRTSLNDEHEADFKIENNLMKLREVIDNEKSNMYCTS